MNSIATNLSDLSKLDTVQNPVVFRVLTTLTALAIISLAGGLLIDRLYRPAAFQIKEIVLTGNPQHVEEQAMREAVVEALKGNYFSIDMAAIHEAVDDQFPWVDEVSIRRRWPDTLMIDIVEHKPVAKCSDGKLLTTQGELIDLPQVDEVWLPVLSAPSEKMKFVYGQYKAWAPAFSKQGLRLVELKLSAQHLWTLSVEVLGQLQTKSFEMVLLESNSASQLDTFLKSIRQNLIGHPSGIGRVDLRYSSGFSIKWNDQISESQQ